MRIPDTPGELARLLATLAEAGANVVGVEHRRAELGLRLHEVEVFVQVETRGPAHAERVVAALTGASYTVTPQ